MGRSNCCRNRSPRINCCGQLSRLPNCAPQLLYDQPQRLLPHVPILGLRANLTNLALRRSDDLVQRCGPASVATMQHWPLEPGHVVGIDARSNRQPLPLCGHDGTRCLPGLGERQAGVRRLDSAVLYGEARCAEPVPAPCRGSSDAEIVPAQLATKRSELTSHSYPASGRLRAKDDSRYLPESALATETATA
jgi:hypothetical protein